MLLEIGLVVLSLGAGVGLERLRQRLAERVCVCRHRLSQHTLKEGVLACTVPGCACGAASMRASWIVTTPPCLRSRRAARPLAIQTLRHHPHHQLHHHRLVPGRRVPLRRPRRPCPSPRCPRCRIWMRCSQRPRPSDGGPGGICARAAPSGAAPGAAHLS